MNPRRRSPRSAQSAHAHAFTDAPDLRRRGLWLVLAFLGMATAVFGRLAADARRALTLDDCAAAVVWRAMLGKNEKVGWCFPLPPGCTESGTRIAPLANTDRGSNADRGFA